MVIFAFALLAALALAPAAFAEDEQTAPVVRLWPAAENTRLVIESKNKTSFRVFALDSPPRVVVDLRIAAGEKSLADIAAAVDISPAAAYLRGFRVARRGALTVRAVFDLAAAATHSASRLAPIESYGHRVVVDVTPTEKPDLLRDLLRRIDPPPPGGFAPSEKPFFVVLDPGHGGEDPGAVSRRSGRLEKDVALAIARAAARSINAHPRMRAALTRERDLFLPLADRVRRAHLFGADIFLSIHADSVESPKPRGSSVYVLSRRGASSRLARRLARHANLSDLVGGGAYDAGDDDLAATLLAFTRDGKERASQNLGAMLLEELGKAHVLHSPRVEAAGFAVLKSPSIPSALVETAFLSNPDDEKKLHDPAFRARLAEAVTAAVLRYRDAFHVDAPFAAATN